MNYINPSGTFLLCLLLCCQVSTIVSKCLQKNTNREAHRDVYRCDNQLFEPGKMHVDPENCQCYYHCNYRQQPCYECCPDGQIFHAKHGCVLSSAYQCRQQNANFQCQWGGLFSHQHCRKYWDCRGGLPVEEACPEDHHWDDIGKVCRKDSEVTRSSCQ